MRIEYKLLESGEGIIITREPQIFIGNVEICFLNAPTETSVILENEGRSFHRALDKGRCAVPGGKLSGSIKVTAISVRGDLPPKKWRCDSIKAAHTETGGVLIFPNDTDVGKKIMELKLADAELRSFADSLNARIKELEERLNKLYEGYDLV